MNAQVQPHESAGVTLLDALINEIRQLPKPWQQTSEAEQQVVIDRLRRSVENAVRSLVGTIAAARFARIPATIDSVTFKDGVKAVLKLSKGYSGTYELAENTGGQALVVLASHQQFVDGIERIKADADQPDMFQAPDGIDDEVTSEIEEQSADSLVEHLAAVNVHVDADTAGAWTEQQRAVAWEWALDYADKGDESPLARPHWLPMPEKTSEAPTDEAKPRRGRPRKQDSATPAH